MKDTLIPIIYVKNINNNVLSLRGTRHSLRMRQRGYDSEGNKMKSLRFISWKEMMNSCHVYNQCIIYNHHPKL